MTEPAPANAAILVADRSGSMKAILTNTVISLNEYIDGLRSQSDVTFTMIRFDTVSTDVVHRRVRVAEVPALTPADIEPRGGTPLIDAVAIAIATAKQEYADTDRVVIVAMTDGLENASRGYTLAQLHDLIKERAAVGWEFIFLGASIDAYRDSGRFGIASASAMSYDAMDLGASRSAYRSAARRSSEYFSTGASPSFSDDEKRAAGDKFIPTRRS